MKAQEFFELAKRTRMAQKLYFRSRLQGDLMAAKGLERELDKAVEAGLDTPADERPTDTTNPTPALPIAKSSDGEGEVTQGILFTEEGDEQ